MIGNKCDCEPKRDVWSGRVEQLAWSQGIPFMETSAKTGHNIDKVRAPLVSLWQHYKSAFPPGFWAAGKTNLEKGMLIKPIASYYMKYHLPGIFYFVISP